MYGVKAVARGAALAGAELLWWQSARQSTDHGCLQSCVKAVPDDATLTGAPQGAFGCNNAHENTIMDVYSRVKAVPTGTLRLRA
jgi:hypothetical protein